MIDVPRQGELPLEEVKRRGEERYEQLRQQLEAEHWNEYIAIDVETGDYAIAKRRGAAWKAIHGEHSKRQAYIRKIGDEPDYGLPERVFDATRHGPQAGSGSRASTKQAPLLDAIQTSGRDEVSSANGSPLSFNDLLTNAGIDPKCVLVFRHRPPQPELNKVLPWLAAQHPELYNAYQQTQSGAKVEQVMHNLEGTGCVASFVARGPGKAVFVGLFRIDSSKPLTPDQFASVHSIRALQEVGAKLWFTNDSGRQSVLWFDLTLTPFLSQWKGKLIIGWPPPERSWWRRAHKNVFPVLAVVEESALERDMPTWDELELSWRQLKTLPGPWRAKLSEWRGVYLIFDTSDGKGYVGSAYGHDNLLGRWRNYGDSGHGGNSMLRIRNPDTFIFTILQRVSPDADRDSVVQIESTWKERLHTRTHGLNEN